MSLSFLITALMVKPQIWSLLKGFFIPTIPEGSLLTIVGIIGTTVVPYNLFLHAALIKKRWQGASNLPGARKDAYWSIGLGGIVSCCIVISAAAVPFAGVKSIDDLAFGLEPLFGQYAKFFLGFGMLAAGLTSAITAPLAAALVAGEIFGWSHHLSAARFRAIWVPILVLGVLFSAIGLNLIEVIRWAQFFNGLLLPVIAVFLVWIVNKKTILARNTNTITQNVSAFFVIIVTLFLGLKGMLSFFV